MPTEYEKNQNQKPFFGRVLIRFLRIGPIMRLKDASPALKLKLALVTSLKMAKKFN